MKCTAQEKINMLTLRWLPMIYVEDKLKLEQNPATNKTCGSVTLTVHKTNPSQGTNPFTHFV